MKVLMLSSDRNIHDPHSSVAKRITALKSKLELLDVIVVDGANKVRNFLSLLGTIITSSKRYDIVTAQDPFFIGMLGLVAAWCSGAKLNVQLHTDPNRAYIFESMRHVASYFVMCFVLRFAHTVRVVSTKAARTIRSYTAARIDVLPIAINIEQLRVLREHPTEYGEHAVVLAASRLVGQKRIELIILAMKHVPHAHLYIVGDGPRRGALHRAGVIAGLQERVHFLGWQHDMAPYFQHAHCFVNASTYEGYGMTLVESLVCGTPVVTTDVGVATELPKEYVTVVAPYEYEMGAAIQGVLDSGARAAYTIEVPSREEYAKLFIQALV